MEVIVRDCQQCSLLRLMLTQWSIEELFEAHKEKADRIWRVVERHSCQGCRFYED